MFEVGSPPQIPRSITILPAGTTWRELRHGLFKVTFIKNGQREVLSFGFMVNVSVSPAIFLAHSNYPWRTTHSGVRQKYIMVSAPRIGPSSSFKPSISSSVIQHAKHLRDTGLALVTYFYCDFRDRKKQEVTGLLASLVSQLSAKSDLCCDILSALYSECDGGSQRPEDNTLICCLEKMLRTEGLPTVYIIVDALDECPTDSGVKSHRERVLDLVNKLVDLHLPNLRICATSRPEADIQAALTSSASHTISLHGEAGQNKDIADYVRSVVYSDGRMQKWREKDKDMVIGTLSQKADGM